MYVFTAIVAGLLISNEVKGCPIYLLPLSVTYNVTSINGHLNRLVNLFYTVIRESHKELYSSQLGITVSNIIALLVTG